MKIQTFANPLISSENMSSSVMGMDTKGIDMATYYLRDKIYSDKVLAVVREYVCNAIDEHKKHAISRPIDFGLRKNETDEEFFVRDYAKGLSEEDMRNIFGMYFRSTKSNDNNLIGGLGLGSKSLFSYTDTFYIKSYHDGVCSLYVCALGGGKTGVSVGNILKVGENPTNESGLEVFATIKKGDAYSFNLKSRNFIKFCSASIKYHYFNEVFEPETPIASFQKNGFGFRIFDNGAEEVLLSMGDVVYEKSYFRHQKARFVKKTMVIDIPIGKMSLPISRESFEDTVANARVRTDILQAREEMVKEDIDSIPPMSVLELIKDSNDCEVNGKYFSLYKKDIYKDIYAFVQTIRIAGDSSKDFEKQNGKIICAVTKSSKTDYWLSKLDEHAVKNGKKYYLTRQSVLNESAIEKLSEVFEFRSVKSKIFNWPISKGDKKELSLNDAYVVNIKDAYGYYIKYTLSPLQLYNKLALNHNLDSAESIEEMTENLSKIKFDSLKKLNSFSIKRQSFTSSCDSTVTASKNMHSNLIQLGFLDADGADYKSKREEILKNEREKSLQAGIVNSMQKKFLAQSHSDKLLDKAQRNFKFAKNASKLFDKIAAENSMRGKILKSIEHSAGYWGGFNPQLSRNELRKILLLK